jgi:hypothetical protein
MHIMFNLKLLTAYFKDRRIYVCNPLLFTQAAGYADPAVTLRTRSFHFISSHLRGRRLGMVAETLPSTRRLQKKKTQFRYVRQQSAYHMVESPLAGRVRYSAGRPEKFEIVFDRAWWKIETVVSGEAVTSRLRGARLRWYTSPMVGMRTQNSSFV